MLLKYWPHILAAVVAASLTWGLHLILMSWKEAEHKKELAALEFKLTTEFNELKKKTEADNRDYQNQILILSNRAASAKRLHGKKCVSVPSSAETSLPNGTSPGTEHVGSDDYDVGDFVDYGETCEGFRIRLKSLTKFVDDVWSIE